MEMQLILILLYIYTGIEQLSNEVLDAGNQVSQYCSGRLQRAREEVRMSHVIMDYSWRHQYELMSSLV